MNYRQHLFDILYHEHGITALESELNDIAEAVHRDENEIRRAYCNHENKTSVIVLDWTTKYHCPECNSYFYKNNKTGNITYVMKGTHKPFQEKVIS